MSRRFWKVWNVARLWSSLSSSREDFEAHSNGSLLKPIDLESRKEFNWQPVILQQRDIFSDKLPVVRLLMIACFSILYRLLQAPCISHILLKLPVTSSDSRWTFQVVVSRSRWVSLSWPEEGSCPQDSLLPPAWRAKTRPGDSQMPGPMLEAATWAVH